ncbi:MAG: hypothetical protein PHQ47_02755 [Candidatus Portnoybacteria bacterium]|nr:hypothetical protein [Candidatus Portnoybacteria bacterium]
MKKIFFSASTYSTPELIENYLAIMDAIKKNDGCILIDWVKEWLSLAKKYKKQNKKVITGADVFKNVDRRKFLDIHNKMILQCDAVIAEVTRPSTSVGYQLLYALAHKKPVLALYQGDAPDLDIEGIKRVVDTASPLIYLKKYTANSLNNIIKNFFHKSSSALKKFNFLISAEIEYYIKWLNKNQPEKSYSELLREKISNDIIACDKEYQKHLEARIK